MSQCSECFQDDLQRAGDENKTTYRKLLVESYLYNGGRSYWRANNNLCLRSSSILNTLFHSSWEISLR